MRLEAVECSEKMVRERLDKVAQSFKRWATGWRRRGSSGVAALSTFVKKKNGRPESPRPRSGCAV